MSFLTLPTELRHEIYSHLSVPGRTIWPFHRQFHDTFIAAFSHKPPQRACHFLYHDINTHFYSIATVSVRPSLYGLQNLLPHHNEYPAIREARNIEFEMTWPCYENLWNVQDVPSLEDRGCDWPRESALELKMLRMLKLEAECLQKLVVQVNCRYDDTLAGALIQERLGVLRETRNGVVVVAGEATRGVFCMQDKEMQKVLDEYVRKLNAERV